MGKHRPHVVNMSCGEVDIFRKQIEILSEQNDNFNKIFAQTLKKEIWSKADYKQVIQDAALALLDHANTQLLGSYLRPWLLELLGYLIDEQFEAFSNVKHKALCVALSQLILVNTDVVRFI